MPAVLFGSIGTVAEVSELQRKAFNQAFADNDLDWNWSQEEYAELLQKSGGEQRIAEYAEARGDEVDAAAVYATKSEVFRKLLADGHPALRDGAAETIAAAKRDDLKVALVTTTSRENIDALAAALAPEIAISDLDLVVDKSQVGSPKPSGDAYEFALSELGEKAGDCVAIENNVDGVSAAKAAGIACVAYPGEDNAEHDFAAADLRLEHLSLDDVRPLLAS